MICTIWKPGLNLHEFPRVSSVVRQDQRQNLYYIGPSQLDDIARNPPGLGEPEIFLVATQYRRLNDRRKSEMTLNAFQKAKARSKVLCFFHKSVLINPRLEKGKDKILGCPRKLVKI